jgi:hypothetical protein
VPDLTQSGRLRPDPCSFRLFLLGGWIRGRRGPPPPSAGGGSGATAGRRMQRTIGSCTVLWPVVWEQVAAADAVGIVELLFFFFLLCIIVDYLW